MNNVPIFRTHGSIGGSILTLEEETTIKKFAPKSILAIAKNYNLNKVYICDSSFVLFVQAYKLFNDNNIQVIWGIDFRVCNNVEDKSEDSLKTESKVRVWMKNSAGYKDLIKLYTLAFTKFGYYGGRLDWKVLNSEFSDNLLVTIPFYSSFIYTNNLDNGTSVPNLDKLNPIFEISSCNLPFDMILKEKLENYLKLGNKFEILEVAPIYYYSRKDFKNYMVFKCMGNRSNKSTYVKPNIDYFSSDCFSFEHYCYLNKIEFREEIYDKKD